MIGKILKELKEYKAAAIITPFFMLLEVAMEVIIPKLMSSIINDGIYDKNQGHIYFMGGFMVLAALFALFAGWQGARFSAKASMGLGKNVRKAVFRKIQSFSFANIDKFSTSGLVTRMTTDITNIQNAFQMTLRMAMRAPASIIASMVMAFIISPKIASIYLAAILFLGLVLFLLARFAMKYFDKAFQRYDDLNESVQENVSAIRVVKAYVREDHEKVKFRKASQAIYDVFTKAESLVVLNNPFMMGTVYTCIILISWIGAHLVVGGELGVGDLSALLTYCMSILMSLMMLAMIFVMLSMSLASIRRVAEVLDEEPSLANPKEPIFEVADGGIEFEHVSFRYSTTAEAPVLDDISLTIKPGETIGIIGGTGSSKSTLVNMISRLYDVDEGVVRVGGIDVKEYDLDTLRNQVSVVLQQNTLFSGSILDNLRWGDENATEEECIHACKLACADEFIQTFPDGYNTHIEQGGNNVSGGQKQRLCIARALLKNPKILILDDSTSAVDTATDARIRKSFREEIPGTTKLIIAQRISSVMDADRIIVLEDGRLNGFGTHEELLASNAIYRDVYDSQTNGGGDFDEGGAQ